MTKSNVIDRTDTNVTKDIETTSTETSSPLTLGAKLKKQREAKNITLESIAAQMHISKQIITSIENNNYSNIVAPIYARGYLKSIAKILSLSEDEILNDFDQLNIFDKKRLFEDKTSYALSNQKIELQSASSPHNKVGTKYLVSFVVALFIVISVALLLGHSWKKTIDSNADQSTESTQSTEATLPITQNQQTENAGVTTDSEPKNDQEAISLGQPVDIGNNKTTNKDDALTPATEKNTNTQ